MPERDLVEKCYVVTGANTGIGKETARELARRGARVLLACRSREKTEAAIEELRSDTGSDALEWVELDLGSLASVRSAARITRRASASSAATRIVRGGGVVMRSAA